jgi:hypothetical protein
MSLSNKVKTAVMALTIAVAGAGVFLAPAVYADYNSCMQAATTAADKAKCGMNDTGQRQTDASGQEVKLENTVTNIINGVLYVIGILAVVMVIIGGVKYTTSGGDQAAVTSAKNTILYGIIGLVIAILAYAIVNFVISKIG